MPHPNHTKDEIRDIFTRFGISDDSLACCKLVGWDLDLAPIVGGEKVIGELNEGEKKFASLLQCVGKDMIVQGIHPLAIIMLVEEFWDNVREGHCLGSQPLGIRENGTRYSVVQKEDGNESDKDP